MALLQFYLIIVMALEGSCVSTSNDQQPHIVKARLGENVTLKCVPEVDEALIHVSWKKLNSDDTTDGRMSSKGNLLAIENLQITDAGLYNCQALFDKETGLSMQSQTIRLEVKVPTCTLRSYHESDCGYLTSNCSSNGIVRYNTKCSFKCDVAHVLLGSPLLTCGSNNTFDYPLPKCSGKDMYAVLHQHSAGVGTNVVMHCGGDLGDDEYNVYWYKYGANKTLLLRKTSAGEQATYIDRGYQTKNGTDLLIPNATKGDSGTYQCDVFSLGSYYRYPYNSSLLVSGTCTMPTLAGALHTNTTTCRSEATIDEGTVCHYYCQSYFRLVGQHSTTCLENGSLSERVPYCRPKEELKEGQARHKWLIAVIMVPVLIFGAIGAFGIWKWRKRVMGDYEEVSTDSGMRGSSFEHWTNHSKE